MYKTNPPNWHCTQSDKRTCFKCTTANLVGVETQYSNNQKQRILKVPGFKSPR